MKTLAMLAAIGLALTALPSDSHATWTGGDNIEYVRQHATGNNGGHTVVQLSNVTCSASNRLYYVNRDRDDGERMHRLLVAAHLAGRKVSLGHNNVDSTGMCQVYAVTLL